MAILRVSDPFWVSLSENVTFWKGCFNVTNPRFGYHLAAEPFLLPGDFDRDVVFTLQGTITYPTQREKENHGLKTAIFG